MEQCPTKSPLWDKQKKSNAHNEMYGINSVPYNFMMNSPILDAQGPFW